ncbi:putative ABC transporter ATP-binding domain protein [Candidatus Cyrtobacter comes]|uniref:ABC transporter ATP-binding domain protein n=1 Tax=Candidatus Cyrtobacter comes TaxID=675776 RepID=A0ABU5L6D1_9RICK|nr:ATP-binding cassette domain-containing protein [Candidatus Cyrtobacter comes]MDZ5761684.1 putative ABC transporter ATP-binding domain protein [Candidatus Cyrtobacter comes]
MTLIDFYTTALFRRVASIPINVVGFFVSKLASSCDYENPAYNFLDIFVRCAAAQIFSAGESTYSYKALLALGSAASITAADYIDNKLADLSITKDGQSYFSNSAIGLFCMLSLGGIFNSSKLAVAGVAGIASGFMMQMVMGHSILRFYRKNTLYLENVYKITDGNNPEDKQKADAEVYKLEKKLLVYSALIKEMPSLLFELIYFIGDKIWAKSDQWIEKYKIILRLAESVIEAVFSSMLELNIDSFVKKMVIPVIKESVLKAILEEEKNIIKVSSSAKFAEFMHGLEINIIEFVETSVGGACRYVFGAQYIIDMLRNPSGSFIKYTLFEVISWLTRSDSKIYHENSKTLGTSVFLRNMMKFCLTMHGKQLVEKGMFSEVAIDVNAIERRIEMGVCKKYNLEGCDFCFVYEAAELMTSFVQRVINITAGAAGGYAANWGFLELIDLDCKGIVKYKDLQKYPRLQIDTILEAQGARVFGLIDMLNKIPYNNPPEVVYDPTGKDIVLNCSIKMQTDNSTIRVLSDMRDISLQYGKIYAITGPSGCGKSIFCDALKGIGSTVPGLSMDGTISFPCNSNDEVKIVMVSQNSFFLPSRTLLETVTCLKPEDDERASLEKVVGYIFRLLEKNGSPESKDGLYTRINEFQNDWCTALSGGQQKKVDIARVIFQLYDLYKNPGQIKYVTVIMDEVLVGLDKRSALASMEVLRQVISGVNEGNLFADLDCVDTYNIKLGLKANLLVIDHNKEDNDIMYRDSNDESGFYDGELAWDQAGGEVHLIS